ncbi:MAG: ATP-dependent DNA helicase [Clostridium butyricum]|nr:ATP-dependent DNA helicase [Clostridium butyricum]
MEKVIIKESVRNLVEFCLKDGDIDNRFSGSARAVEGIKAHQKLQSDNEKVYEKFQKEVYLSHDFQLQNAYVTIEGRADGIIEEDNKIIIEEIKSTYKKYSYIDDLNELHWAQAKVYAFIYGQKNNISDIYIRLSYFQLDTNEVKSFERKFNISELEIFTFDLVKEYEKFISFIYMERLERNLSAKQINFPFEKYREGQRRLINIAYNTIKESEIVFAQAPTGIGKTISTIFSAIKALGEGIGERIVYLTSRTINKEVANEAIERLRQKGLYFKSITITAKEKSCCNKKFDCNPEVCKYARGYYGKVKKPIYEILNREVNISLTTVQEYAEKYEVCPFELSLDLSMYCDGIICDYNYIFDPRVSLGRLIESDGNIVLIDEAHNLIDRARNMYSAIIEKQMIMDCKKITKGRLNKLNSILGKINSHFIELRNECEHRNVEWFYEKEEPKALNKLLKLYLKESEEILAKGNKFEGYEEILKLYFEIYSFTNIIQLYDENYVTLIKKEGKDVSIGLFCVNPAKNIKTYLNKCYSVIFFSATLSPINYYVSMLGGNSDSYRVKLPSPFKKENLKMYLTPINLRYRYRKQTLPRVSEKIYNFINEKIGNYIIFCPSYAYMNQLVEEITKYNVDKFKLEMQNPNMTEEEKVAFLDKFKLNRNLIVFCVMGGMFSEGIDLPGEQLIGAVIIGVGYPKVDIENEIVKEFFGEDGYDYAYIYPGINKIQQGVGRVIRTENDKGRVLLIDDRYSTDKYSKLIPREWYPINKY